MNLALFLARLLLSAIFFTAGLAKLFDRAGSRQAVIDFGGPARLAGPLGLALPLVELGVSLALLPLSSAWLAAVLGLALLLAFMAAIGVNLARGKRPDCRCFGRIQSSPIGWMTFARNCALATVCAFVVLYGREGAGFSVASWAKGLTISEGMNLMIGALSVSLASAAVWLLIQLTAQNGRVLLRLEGLEQASSLTQPALEPTPPAQQLGLPIGTPAPEFDLGGIKGERAALTDLRSLGKAILLVFSDPNCGPCNALMPELASCERDLTQITLVIVSRGPVEANQSKSEPHKLSRVLLQQDNEVGARYRAYGTPSAVLVGPEGAIQSQLAQGADQIRTMLSQIKSGQPALLTPRIAPQTEAVGLRLLKQNEKILGRLDAVERLLQQLPTPPKPQPTLPAGLAVGTTAPSFDLPAVNGGRMSIEQFRGQKLLLIFFNPHCGFCEQMGADLAALPTDGDAGRPIPVVVTTGPVGDNRQFLKKYGIHCPVLRQQQMEVAYLYRTGGTPTGYLIDEEGRIGSELAVGAQALLALAGAVALRAPEPEPANANGNRREPAKRGLE